MKKQPVLFEVPITGQKESKRKSASLDRIKVNHDIAKKRYYLHRRLDKDIFVIDGVKRTITTPYKCFEEIPVGPRFYINKLIKLGYNVQYTIV